MKDWTISTARVPDPDIERTPLRLLSSESAVNLLISSRLYFFFFFSFPFPFVQTQILGKA